MTKLTEHRDSPYWIHSNPEATTTNGGSSVRPCVHPGCNDGNGNHILTAQTMCEHCRRHYRRELDWIVIDYATLKAFMPTPVRRTTQIKATSARTFGHPAQWASDMAAQIADELNWAEDSLREHVHMDPPPHPGTREAGRVAHAYKTLTDRFDDLVTYPGAEATAQRIHDIHRQIRSSLGLTKLVQRLPDTPCPNCGTAALTRDVGQITCGDCANIIRPEHYEFFTRILLDELIDAYDARDDTQTEANLA